MRVLILPEDFTKDQYMLKPIIEAMMKAVGKPNAVVRVCQEPRFHGVDQLLDWEQLQPVIERYRGRVDLFLLCVDRDGKAGRRVALDRLEQLAEETAPGRVVLAENAWQEIEVWVLAGHDLPKGWNWKTIRQEEHPKENYYLLFAEKRGVKEAAAEGRKILAQEAAAVYRRLRQRCKEDIQNLETRIAERIKRDES